LRVFVGVPLDDAAIEALLPVQEALRQGRLVDEENLHLTLAFLDDQPEAALAELDAALQDIRVSPWEMEFTGIEAQGGRRPVLVWAEVAKAEPLRQLHDKVRGAARLAGIDLPRERFRPHVTRARFRKRIRAEELDALRLFLARNAGYRGESFSVRDVVLYESELLSDGAVHTELARYPLPPPSM